MTPDLIPATPSPTTGRARTALTRTVAGVVLAGLLTGLGAGVATAGAPAPAPVSPIGTVATVDTVDPDEGMRLMSSRGITIQNNTGDTMTLAGVDGDQRFEGRPEDGSTIAPGGSHRWELTYLYARTNADTVVYTLTRPDGSHDGSVTLDLRVTSIGVWEPSVTTACTTISAKSGVTCEAGGSTVTLSAL